MSVGPYGWTGITEADAGKQREQGEGKCEQGRGGREEHGFQEQPYKPSRAVAEWAMPSGLPVEGVTKGPTHVPGTWGLGPNMT